jgi:hypothetical protein
MAAPMPRGADGDGHEETARTLRVIADRNRSFHREPQR